MIIINCDKVQEWSVDKWGIIESPLTDTQSDADISV